ncbi:MAG: hypothetical protein ACK418_25715, partial [Pseudomonas sp.]
MIDTFPGALRTTVLCLATAVSLGGCGTFPDHLDPDDALLHEAMQGTGAQRPPVDPASERAPLDSGQLATRAPAQRQLIRGNQQFVRPPAVAAVKEEGSGDIVLAAATPEGWKQISRFKVPEKSKIRKGGARFWTHPVVSNGRLYIRDQDWLFCFDV